MCLNYVVEYQLFLSGSTMSNFVRFYFTMITVWFVKLMRKYYKLV